VRTVIRLFDDFFNLTQLLFWAGRAIVYRPSGLTFWNRDIVYVKKLQRVQNTSAKVTALDTPPSLFSLARSAGFSQALFLATTQTVLHSALKVGPNDQCLQPHVQQLLFKHDTCSNEHSVTESVQCLSKK